jgi:post-segregation antitoxin (ccd killing protein)
MMEKVKKERITFGIHIDKELKKRLKIYCVNNNITMTEAIEEALEEYLQKRNAL